MAQKRKRTKKNPEMLDYKTVKKLLRTLRDLGLIHERLNQSTEVLNKLYNRLCKPVDENKVFLAVQAIQEEGQGNAGLVVRESLLEKLSHEEINYAVTYQMLKVTYYPGLTTFNWVFDWMPRQDRDSWCQPKRVPGLLEFIKDEFSETIKRNMGNLALSEVFERVEKSGKFPAYTERDIAQELVILRILNKINLKVCKSLLAKNLGIELVEINGIRYGFLKIEEELS